MGKKNNKKPLKKNGKSQQIKKDEQRTKLGPGKKQCRNCREVIPIHKKICTECGHVHQMKKNKEDIMKCLSKVTPIVIKSIIENNDFNEFKGWDQEILFSVGPVQKEKQQNAPNSLMRNNSSGSRTKKSDLTKKKSNTLSKSESQSKTIKRLNHNQFSCAFFKNPISCIASSRDWVVAVQTIEKIPLQLEEKQLLTIKAYNLEYFNLVGVDYIGNSIIHFSFCPPHLQQIKSIRFSTINIKQYVRKVKVFANMLIILTGRSTLVVASLPNSEQTTESHEYSILDKVQIIQPLPDKITSFQFLRSTTKEDRSVMIIVGTLYGRITVYKVNSEGYTIIKFIPCAHFEMVTALSQCPINQNNQEQQIKSIIFSSGSYDGSVKIWELHENSPIFQYECSNRKIWSIYWDPGAKYLVINRDQINDPCIIICFFSINKIEECVNLSSTAQTRNIKTQKQVTMISHDYYSKNLAVFDPTNGTLKIISLEELRCNSLKKKKPKKDESLEKLYRVFWKDGQQRTIGSLPEIEELTDTDVHEKKWIKGQMKKFPLFSGICVQAKQTSQFIYLSTINGEVIIMKNII